MLNQIILLVSGCVSFLGGFLVVWGAVSLGLAICERQGCAQFASAISTIAGEADRMEGYRRQRRTYLPVSKSISNRSV